MSETVNISTTAVRWANYPGNLTESAVGQTVGPNTFGEKMMAVSAVYDEALNQTRIGYTFLPKAQS